MNPSSSKRSESLQRIFGAVAVQQESLFYVLVSAMDFFMTYLLLCHRGAVFVESNPVARFFLREWGAKGLIYFKFAMVAFVCVLAQIIAQRRPRVARMLLTGATLVVGIVVVYSLKLLLIHGQVADIEL